MLIPWLPVLPWNKLRVGQRVRLSGGHSLDPTWLAGRKEILGRVNSFIPGQNRQSAVLVDLDEPLEFDGMRGEVVVLDLRFVGARWRRHEIVGIELCDFRPEPKAVLDRRHCKRIESHASYTAEGYADA